MSRSISKQLDAHCPKSQAAETEIPSQPAVYTVHDRKFIVDTVYKDEPAETLKTYKKGH